MKKALLIFFVVILVDQVVKFYIKTHFYYQEQVPMFGENCEWAYLHFTENNGMAFGMELEGEYGKLLLSVFRILAVGGIGWYLWDLIKKKAHAGLVAAIAFIFAGAIGNIIDSAFYGLIFSDSRNMDVATLFPAEGGYAGFLHGRVVDMFYFPMVSWDMPTWVPIWGGESCTFFSPVFNVADASITIGVVMIILFQKKYFPKQKPEEEVVSGDLVINTTSESVTETNINSETENKI